jgi:hypothetical protein
MFTRTWEHCIDPVMTAPLTFVEVPTIPADVDPSRLHSSETVMLVGGLEPTKLSVWSVTPYAVTSNHADVVAVRIVGIWMSACVLVTTVRVWPDAGIATNSAKMTIRKARMVAS